MGRIAILAVIMFVASGIAGISILAYSQQEAEQQQIANTISTEVVSVDSEKSTLLIKTVKDAVAGTSENQVVPVLPETKILNGDVVLKLSDLKVGDKVNIKYTTDTLGVMEVASINLEGADTSIAEK
jgi:hypothetical protein